MYDPNESVESDPYGREIRERQRGSVWSWTTKRARDSRDELNRKKWGFPVGTTRLSLLWFAYNFWLLATNEREAKAMYDCLIELLEQVGWEVPFGEISFCTILPDDFPVAIAHRGQQMKRKMQKEGFGVLGTKMTFENRHHAELEYRISRAWRAFWAISRHLCCDGVSIIERLKALERVVAAGLFYCSGSWNLTVRDLSRLRSTQSKMI